MRTPSLTLLFVCTANIARSPYAERRARMLLGDTPVAVASAGIPGYPGRPMDLEMADQLRLRGGDPTGHLSRRLDEGILDPADVALTFAFEHHLRILRDWPKAADRTFGLRQFAGAVQRIEPSDLDGRTLVARIRSVAQPNSMALDLEDPFGRGRRKARLAAEEIDSCVLTIVSSLVGAPVADASSAGNSPRRAFKKPAPWRFRRRAPRRAIDEESEPW